MQSNKQIPTTPTFNAPDKPKKVPNDPIPEPEQELEFVKIEFHEYHKYLLKAKKLGKKSNHLEGIQ